MGSGKGQGQGQGKGKGGFFAWLHEAVGNFICMVVCTPVIGLICLVVGIGMFAYATHDDRSDSIQVYNSAVSAWTNTHRSQFANNTFRFGKHTMQAVTTLDILDDNDPALMSFSPLSFSYPVSNSVQLTRLSGTIHACTGANSCVHRNISFPTQAERSLSYSELNCDPSPPLECRFKSTRRRCRAICRDSCLLKGGEWFGNDGSRHSGRCVKQIFLLEVCMRFNENNEIASTRGPNDQGGCYHDEGRWSIGVFANSRQSQVIVRARSDLDPFVAAHDITDGKLNFGLTTKQKLKIGTTLLAVGSLLFCLPLCVVLFLCSRRNSSSSGSIVQPAVEPYGYGHPAPLYPNQQQYPPPQYSPAGPQQYNAVPYQQPGAPTYVYGKV